MYWCLLTARKNDFKPKEITALGQRGETKRVNEIIRLGIVEVK